MAEREKIFFITWVLCGEATVVRLRREGGMPCCISPSVFHGLSINAPPPQGIREAQKLQIWGQKYVFSVIWRNLYGQKLLIIGKLTPRL